MIKKLLLSAVALAGLAMPTAAQQDDTQKDFLYVVKDGKVMGTYEIGKDVDYITFTKPETPQTANFVKYGDTTVELKSAFVTTVYGYIYVFASPKENIPTDYTEIMGGTTNYLMVAIPEEKLGEEINLAEYVKTDDGDFTAYYMDAAEYEALGGTTFYDFNDEGYTSGTLKVEVVDGQCNVAVKLTNADSGKDFEVSYQGKCATPSASDDNTFNVDDLQKQVKAAFYSMDEANAVVDLYLTNANIESARDLENCYQYAHVQVPYSALTGEDIDITGDGKDFKFDFVDNIQEQTYSLSRGNVGNATGTISVQMMTEDTYKVNIDIQNFGTGRSFSSKYNDSFQLYDLSVPNAYRLQNQDDTSLNSAVATHNDGIYTIYLSAKEGVTTVEGMADADIVMEVPDEFMTGELKGFSGTDTNAKISVTYDGVKYNKASCNDAGDDAVAIGGNASAKIDNGTIAVDFSVFNIYKYDSANLTGHFEGSVTVVE